MKVEQNAANLFDTVIEEAGLKNDAALAKMLGILPSQLCNIRAKRVKLGPTIIVRLMESHPISLRRINDLLKEPDATGQCLKGEE